jgi:hypothetical protein
MSQLVVAVETTAAKKRGLRYFVIRTSYLLVSSINQDRLHVHSLK